MKFVDWDFKFSEDTDGVRWNWAEFYFENDEMLTGSSPMYAEGASDFECLRWDALRVAKRLREGAPWEEVCLSFRQAW